MAEEPKWDAETNGGEFYRGDGSWRVTSKIESSSDEEDLEEDDDDDDDEDEGLDDYYEYDDYDGYDEEGSLPHEPSDWLDY